MSQSASLEYTPWEDKGGSAESSEERLIYLSKDNNTLASVLEYCEIRAFTAQSVKAYKGQAAREANARLWVYWSAAAIGHITWLVFGICVVMIAGSGSKPESFQEVSLYWAGLIFSAMVFMTFSLTQPAMKGRARWKVVPHWKYTGAIPEFARCYIREIQKELPGVKFNIHQLVQREWVLDPFLSVSHDSEEHFIAVWDEPEFKD